MYILKISKHDISQFEKSKNQIKGRIQSYEFLFSD